MAADRKRAARPVATPWRFTVLYRSRPVCDIVPIGAEPLQLLPLEEDPLFEADAVGRSTDGRTAADHDDLLYRHE